MKLCPTCGNQWPDEQKFCPNDGSALKTAGTTDLVGGVIAEKFHIQKKLGEGGMGAVYLGEHVKMGRKSAIKVMTQSMAQDPDAIARFNREAANAARINHPNVCAIYDFGETKDGLIYLAMEYIEGEALSDCLEREGALSPKRAANIFQQAGDALQAAHDLGIVHRDLKPDNIMLTKGRTGDVVKVVDFGIAKAMTGEEGQKVTKTGLVVGTPEYMSPEQLAGDKLDGRSDIYSLALVLFRMLTGTLPFQAESAQEVMIKRLTDEPMPLNAARPGAEFPARLQAVMDRALQRMPSERYGSAAEMARDVAAAVGGMADLAPAVDTEGATQLMSAQTAGAAAKVPKTRVAGARTQTPDTPAVARAPTAVAPAPKKKSPALAIAAVVGVLVVGGGTAAVVMMRGGSPQSFGAGNPAGVTQGTAQQPAGGNPSSRQAGSGAQPTGGGGGGTTGRNVNQPQNTATPTGGTTQPGGGTSTGTETRARVDSAAVNRDLGDLLDPATDLAPATRASARPKVQSYYDNSNVPANLRAFAAFVLAQSYFMDQRRDDACRWNSLALRLAPSNAQYQKFATQQSCP